MKKINAIELDEEKLMDGKYGPEDHKAMADAEIIVCSGVVVKNLSGKTSGEAECDWILRAVQWHREISTPAAQRMTTERKP